MLSVNPVPDSKVGSRRVSCSLFSRIRQNFPVGRQLLRNGGDNKSGLR